MFNNLDLLILSFRFLFLLFFEVSRLPFTVFVVVFMFADFSWFLDSIRRFPALCA
jgi:hypothetical protein